MRAPFEELRMDEKVELKSVKYELSDSSYEKSFRKSKEFKVVEGVNGKSKPIIKIESSNTILIRGLTSELNRENYQKSKVRTCVNKGSCSMDYCKKDCPLYTPSKIISIEEMKSKFSEFDIVDRGPSVEDRCINKVFLEEELKKLKKKDPISVKMILMWAKGYPISTISEKTGIPKSTVFDRLKKIHKYFAEIS